MILLGLLLSLAAPSRAQIAPAPVEQVTPAGLDDIFSRFTSGRPMIPTLKEVQAAQLKRDLAPRNGEGDASSGLGGSSELGHFNQPPMPGVRRASTESVDVAVSRPLRRVQLGVGASEQDVNVGNRPVSSDTSGYGFVRLDLSKAPLARKLLHSPTAIHAQNSIQDDKVSISKDEYTVDFLKHPR